VSVELPPLPAEPDGHTQPTRMATGASEQLHTGILLQGLLMRKKPEKQDWMTASESASRRHKPGAPSIVSPSFAATACVIAVSPGGIGPVKLVFMLSLSASRTQKYAIAARLAYSGGIGPVNG
jgi:hypothetical protein